VPFARAVLFKDGLIHGEIGYFDFATLCEQVGVPLEDARERVTLLREELTTASSD
jgi:hypothetical protein